MSDFLYLIYIYVNIILKKMTDEGSFYFPLHHFLRNPWDRTPFLLPFIYPVFRFLKKEGEGSVAEVVETSVQV